MSHWTKDTAKAELTQLAAMTQNLSGQPLIPATTHVGSQM